MEGLTDGKIKESINNVFRSAKSQQRGREFNQQPLQPIVNISQQPSQSNITISQQSSQPSVDGPQDLNKNKPSTNRDKENVCSNKKRKC